jgi:hypothetical protein
MNTAPATTIGTQTPAAAPLSATSGGAARIEVKAPPIAGSGAAGSSVALDDFAERGGPDVEVRTEAGMQSMHAVFHMDPATNEMRVSIVDAAGRLVRMIPPDSVAQMIAAMATYHGR